MHIHPKATVHGSGTPSRHDASQWRGYVCRYETSRLLPGPGNHWETLADPDEGDSCSYGDFVPDPDGRYFLSGFLSGSDYSGSLVERSNYREFLEAFEEHDGVHAVYGDFGTYAVALRIDAIDDEMAEVFDGLEDYPLICEQTHCEIELEAHDEAWECWARSDFVREIEARFSEEGDGQLVFVPPSEPEGQARLFETGERPAPRDDEWAIRALFETAREAANEYWIDETGGNVHIDLDRVCDEVTADMLAGPLPAGGGVAGWHARHALLAGTSTRRSRNRSSQT